MNKKDKIFLAGHNGLVGNSMMEQLHHHGYTNINTASKKIRLLDAYKVNKYFKARKFDIVLICLLKVGGIYSNSSQPYKFLVENTTIQNNIFNACLKNKVKKVMYLGSSCIYPKYPKNSDKRRLFIIRKT